MNHESGGRAQRGVLSLCVCVLFMQLTFARAMTSTLIPLTDNLSVSPTER